jgi:hypothetical protein
VAVHEKALVPYLRRATGGERGISMLARVGIGVAFAIAARGHRHGVRDRGAGRRGGGGAAAAASVLWLVPQFALMGVGDGLALVGLYLSVIAPGAFLSRLVITAADRASWFAKDLNRSRLE